jgi:fibronectin type 3 domain-containing protein
VHLVGFIVRIYHYARSSECQPYVACVQKTVQMHKRTALHAFKHLHVPEARVMFRTMSSGNHFSSATPNSHTAGHLLHVLDIQLQIYEPHGTKLWCHDK